jgi:hypothetical protein
MTHRARAVGIVLLALAANWPLRAQDGAPAQAPAGATAPAAVVLTPEEMDIFLREAPFLPRSSRDVGKGVTDSRRATLSDGRLTHDVHIQTVDIERPTFRAGGVTEIGFRDTYRYNIAAYRLARLIGIDAVPMSVERQVDGRRAAVTWWLDNVMMDEKERIAKNLPGPDSLRTSRQVQVMRIFDELIQNSDRNQGNIVWTSDWTLWMIDHTRAFRTRKELLRPDQLQNCERGLLERLRGLTLEAVREAAGRNLTRAEAEAVIARRDLIVQRYERLIAERGADTVLFTLAR